AATYQRGAIRLWRNPTNRRSCENIQRPPASAAWSFNFSLVKRGLAFIAETTGFSRVELQFQPSQKGLSFIAETTGFSRVELQFQPRYGHRLIGERDHRLQSSGVSISAIFLSARRSKLKYHATEVGGLCNKTYAL